MNYYPIPHQNYILTSMKKWEHYITKEVPSLKVSFLVKWTLERKKSKFECWPKRKQYFEIWIDFFMRGWHDKRLLNKILLSSAQKIHPCFFFTLMALLSSSFSVSEVLSIYNFGCAVPFFSSKNATLGMLDRCCYSLIIRESTLLPTILMGYS